MARWKGFVSASWARGSPSCWDPNESGKTTLTALTRHVLYGYPDGRSKERAYAPLAVRGLPRLVFADAAGEWAIERVDGKNRGPVSVTARRGAERPELLGQLVSGVSEQSYRVVFGFGLDELSLIEHGDSADIMSRLYAAGFGLAVNPMDARKAARGCGGRALCAACFQAGGQRVGGADPRSETADRRARGGRGGVRRRSVPPRRASPAARSATRSAATLSMRSCTCSRPTKRDSRRHPKTSTLSPTGCVRRTPLSPIPSVRSRWSMSTSECWPLQPELSASSKRRLASGSGSRLWPLPRRPQMRPNGAPGKPRCRRSTR